MIRNFNTNIDTSFFNPASDTTGFTSTAETIVRSISFNPGDIMSGYTFTITAGFKKGVTNGSTYQIKLYYNTGVTLTSALQLATVTTASGDSTPTLIRTMKAYGDPTFIDSFQPTASSYDDWGDSTSSLDTTVLNNSIETDGGYFLLTAKRTSSGSDGLINSYLVIDV